jgi:hypothetical protein
MPADDQQRFIANTERDATLMSTDGTVTYFVTVYLGLIVLGAVCWLANQWNQVAPLCVTHAAAAAAAHTAAPVMEIRSYASQASSGTLQFVVNVAE